MLTDYGLEGLPEKLRNKLPNESVELMESSMRDFANASTQWHAYVDSQAANLTDPYLVRQLNDVSMRVERVFTENAGRSLFGRPDTRNLLLGTPLDDFYSTLFFPGLHDLLNLLAQTEAAKSRKANHDELKESQQQLALQITELRRHLSDITIALKVATQMLRPRPI